MDAHYRCNVFGRPFVKWFALCYRIMLSVLSVCIVGVLWPNGWMDQDETWHGGRPRPRPHCVRWEPSCPQKGHSSQFSAHVYCDQTAGCISVPFSTEVGLSLCDIVLHGDPAPPPLKGHSPQFLASVRCGQTSG